MDSPVIPPNRANSAERRNYARYRLKPFSTVVVQLGPSNGGSLLDVGGGGLSLQAVAKLRPEVELNLRFRLEGMTEAIDAFGRVTWLGPTQKVAGISFKNLPVSTELEIVQWVDAQQRSTLNDTSTKSDDLPLSPPPISPHRIRRPIADPLTPPSLPVSQNEISLQKKIDLPENKSLGSLIEDSKPVLETLTLSKSATEFSSRRSLSLDTSLFSTSDNDSASNRLRESFASDSRRSRRRKIVIAVMVCVIGILVLFAMDSNLVKSEWVDRLKSFIGLDVPAKLDPARAAVQVWAHDGYYYCADNPNFKTLQPGAVMTQNEALQNKYKPSFGYCH